jgi:signal transduction histidine kinase
MTKKITKLSLIAEKDTTPPHKKAISLADFIRENTEQIVDEWEDFARTLTPASNNMTPLALRDHIHPMLSFIANDIESSQTGSEQVKKSQGKEKQASAATASEKHAALRLAGGFNIDQMVSEYRALRASVIKLWRAANTTQNDVDIKDLTRFNEAIDQILAESVSHYTEKVNYSKDLVFGILSHDLRTPLGVVSMSAQLLLNIGELDERQKMLASQIYESTARITQIVNALLNVTHARFGSGPHIERVAMDMGIVAKQLVDELRAAYPARTINISASGDLEGEWDKARIGQIFSNLIGNAIQYSFKNSPINVIVKGSAKQVLLSVHNEGEPIPAEKTEIIFDALARAAKDEGENLATVNLGMGLYITKDIVVSHGGTIDVTSTKKDGTTFTIKFPRSALAKKE